MESGVTSTDLTPGYSEASASPSMSLFISGKGAPLPQLGAAPTGKWTSKWITGQISASFIPSAGCLGA